MIRSALACSQNSSAYSHVQRAQGQRVLFAHPATLPKPLCLRSTSMDLHVSLSALMVSIVTISFAKLAQQSVRPAQMRRLALLVRQKQPANSGT